ncbi:angiopoietin-4 [Octodon degus]|uniref:Angiopoietin-4 n=1 Tax=Octodon degus TaxID=10160 RepID=A0A6P3V8Y7_OCTDE|nr:angiopoietin-4 [Octodon degus]
MQLGSLLILVATMTAVHVNGQNVDSTQRSHPTSVQGRLLTGTWMEQAENELKNSLLKLQKLKEHIQTILGSELQQAQENMVQNHRTSILQLGTSLLEESTAQTLKLTDIQAQVRNQMSRMEHQMLEALQTTDKLEKQLQAQIRELHNPSRDLETQQRAQLVGLHSLKEQLQQLLDLQSSTFSSVQHNLQAASNSSSQLQQKQGQLLENLQQLMSLVDQGPGPVVLEYQDCDKIHRSGVNVDGIYTILVPNVQEPKRVFCVMDPDGGAWTVIQRRENGTVNFNRNWQDYKQGFGDAAGEHWLGNEAVHHIASSAKYSLRVEVEDWDGNTFSADFGHFQLGSEEQFYRIFLDKHSGVASLQGHLILHNGNFSTRDADHDQCSCNCAVTMSGGWWFDACGASNLNGIYYPAGRHLYKINGIRWPHSAGPMYSLRATRMMIRPSAS